MPLTARLYSTQQRPDEPPLPETPFEEDSLSPLYGPGKRINTVENSTVDDHRGTQSSNEGETTIKAPSPDMPAVDKIAFDRDEIQFDDEMLTDEAFFTDEMPSSDMTGSVRETLPVESHARASDVFHTAKKRVPVETLATEKMPSETAFVDDVSIVPALFTAPSAIKTPITPPELPSKFPPSGPLSPELPSTTLSSSSSLNPKASSRTSQKSKKAAFNSISESQPEPNAPEPDTAQNPSTDGSALTLPHLTSSGDARMISITAKPSTHRIAVAKARIMFSKPDTYNLLKSSSLQKGDALATARIAGIQAAKRASELLPLAHPSIDITHVVVDPSLIPPLGKAGGGVSIVARVDCVGRTGAEMEALTSATVAGLAVYDMCKSVDKNMRLEKSRVIYKSGGRSGAWKWDRQARSMVQVSASDHVEFQDQTPSEHGVPHERPVRIEQGSMANPELNRSQVKEAEAMEDRTWSMTKTKRSEIRKERKERRRERREAARREVAMQGKEQESRQTEDPASEDEKRPPSAKLGKPIDGVVMPPAESLDDSNRSPAPETRALSTKARTGIKSKLAFQRTSLREPRTPHEHMFKLRYGSSPPREPKIPREREFIIPSMRTPLRVLGLPTQPETYRETEQSSKTETSREHELVRRVPVELQEWRKFDNSEKPPIKKEYGISQLPELPSKLSPTNRSGSKLLDLTEPAVSNDDASAEEQWGAYASAEDEAKAVQIAGRPNGGRYSISRSAQKRRDAVEAQIGRVLMGEYSWRAHERKKSPRAMKAGLKKRLQSEESDNVNLEGELREIDRVSFHPDRVGAESKVPGETDGDIEANSGGVRSPEKGNILNRLASYGSSLKEGLSAYLKERTLEDNGRPSPEKGAQQSDSNEMATTRRRSGPSNEKENDDGQNKKD